GVHELPPRPLRPDDRLRAHHPAIIQRDALAPLQLAPQWPFGHARLARSRRVEPSEPFALDQRVADGAAAVFDREGPDLVALARDHAAVLHLADLDLEAGPLDAHA